MIEPEHVLVLDAFDGASMTDSRDSGTKSQPAPSQPKDMASAALVISVEAAEISAEAEEHDRSLARAESPQNQPNPVERPSPRTAIPGRRRAPVRRTRPFARSEPAPIPAQSTPLVAAGDEASVSSQVDTRSELRDWIKDNATLLSNASLLISLAAITLTLLPDVGIFAPYIKALIFAGALLLLIELHHQWPEDLQLHVLRKNPRPKNHSWRMTGFAFVMQVATLVFAAWATLTNPIILLPLTALAVVLGFRQWYFRRHGGLVARSFRIIALVAVLLLSELLMVVVWAAVTGEQVTLELWTEDRPDLQIDR